MERTKKANVIINPLENDRRYDRGAAASSSERMDGWMGGANTKTISLHIHPGMRAITLLLPHRHRRSIQPTAQCHGDRVYFNQRAPYNHMRKALSEAKEFGLQLPLPFLPKGRKEIDHFGMMNQQRPSLCSYTNHQHFGCT
ncbi:hypothetical protein DAPPUDRAFT_235549 [Daphnia pulex]|uniref:Uncharacterized protein n=1 Tax=Daphnia pulex TaxID=6669 RepID=E9G060_DAPPU|nr:hypothetical protein DAPPUDRAFT_235549 [Daphnia pulex]|eukprot:EFX86845.1 hypothetical protein DAPPUDRAFT_235549 [Daphnia pulex]